MHADPLEEIIRHRRTIKPKDYSDRPVPEEIISAILESGNWAPTHGMTEPWRFQVFTGGARKRLSEFMGEVYQKITATEDFKQSKLEKHLSNPLLASCTIAICMQRQSSGKIPEIEEIEAVACAVQNMHLTATTHGLGAFWSTSNVIYHDAMKQFLQLGTDDRCLGLLYLGYPQGEWPTSQRCPIEEKVIWHRE